MYYNKKKKKPYLWQAMQINGKWWSGLLSQEWESKILQDLKKFIIMLQEEFNILGNKLLESRGADITSEPLFHQLL